MYFVVKLEATIPSRSIFGQHFFGELAEVVVGDGRLAGACRTHEQQRHLVIHVDIEEECLSGRLIGRDNQVTHLKPWQPPVSYMHNQVTHASPETIATTVSYIRSPT